MLLIGLLLSNVINMWMIQQVQDICKCCTRESCDVQRIAVENHKHDLNIDSRCRTFANVIENIVAMIVGFLQNIKTSTGSLYTTRLEENKRIFSRYWQHIKTDEGKDVLGMISLCGLYRTAYLDNRQMQDLCKCHEW